MNSLWRIVLVFTAYVALLCAVSFPLIFNLQEAIIGQGPDPYQYIWNADVFKFNASSGVWPFYTDRLLYPHGVNLLMHTYTPIIGIVNLVLANPYLSCNLSILLSLSLAGLGVFLWTQDIYHNKILAFAAGICFMLSSYVTSHWLEHYHLLLLAPVPYVFWILNKMGFDGLYSIRIKPKLLILMGLLGLISLLGDYYTTFYLLFVLLIYLLFSLWPRKWKIKKYAVFVFSIIAWIGIHLVVEHRVQHGADDKGAFYNTADLVSPLIPAENNLLWGGLFSGLRQQLNYRGPNEQVMFMGFLVLLIFLFIPRSNRSREINFLRLTVLLFFFLSLPKIRVLGQPITYSPTSWMHYLPFVNNIRNPVRAVMILQLLVPVVAFYHLDRLKLKNRIWQRAILLVVPMICLLELWPSAYPFINRIEAGDYAAELASEEDVKTVMNLPFGVTDGLHSVGRFNTQLLQDQLVHQKKYLGAYVSRIPAEVFRSYQSDPMIKAVLEPEKPALWCSSAERDRFLVAYQPDLIVLDLSVRNSSDYRHFIAEQFAPYISRQKEIKGKELYYLDRAAYNSMR